MITANHQTAEHDSSTCALGIDGRRCLMCEWAESSRRGSAHTHIYRKVNREFVYVCDCATESDRRKVAEWESKPEQQDAPLVQLPLAHVELRSLKEAHDDAYQRGYQDGWADAHSVRLKMENEDLRVMREMVEGRMGQ
jgi:hypothetical protein